MLSENQIILCAAQLSDRYGFENLSLKLLAEELGIKSPSLYNHVKNLDDLKQKLMLFGWKQMENAIIHSAVGVSGVDALRKMGEAFFEYATSHKGVFNAMLWYNRYQNGSEGSTFEATKGIFEVFFKITSSLGISEENANHLVRTIRSFLEGFSLLVNNNAFGHESSIKESFDISMTIILEGINVLK